MSIKEQVEKLQSLPLRIWTLLFQTNQNIHWITNMSKLGTILDLMKQWIKSLSDKANLKLPEICQKCYI